MIVAAERHHQAHCPRQVRFGLDVCAGLIDSVVCFVAAGDCALCARYGALEVDAVGQVHARSHQHAVLQLCHPQLRSVCDSVATAEQSSPAGVAQVNERLPEESADANLGLRVGRAPISCLSCTERCQLDAGDCLVHSYRCGDGSIGTGPPVQSDIAANALHGAISRDRLRGVVVRPIKRAHVLTRHLEGQPLAERTRVT